MAKRNRGFRRGPRGGYSPAERASLPSGAFLKPETRSWPVSDLQHAKIALQYMSRGFGNRSEYGMLLQRLFERYPPDRYPELAEMYERLQDKIQAKAGRRMARANPQARENWVNFAIQAGLAILPSVVAGFKKLSAKKLAQYERLVASNDIEGQLAFIRKHAWINPGVRAVLANDDAAEWLRVNLNEALAQGAGEAALAAAGTAADVGAAVATAKAGGASGDALKDVAAQTALQAATNPHRSPGLYMLYTPWGALPVAHRGFEEVHWAEEEPDGFNAYGRVIYRINWPRTAQYLLRAWQRNLGSPEDVLFYGVRQDGKQIELSLDDMKRLASMDVAGARKDIQSRNNPRTRQYTASHHTTVFHIEPHGGYREGLEDAKDWGKAFTERGFSSGYDVERSEDRSGPYHKKTVKLRLRDIPIMRVMDRGGNQQVIEQTIQKHVGTLLGSYTESRQESAGGPAVRPNGKSRKKKPGVSRRSVVHQQHIQKTPKAGPYGSKKGKKGYTRKRKHVVRENRSRRNRGVSGAQWQMASKYWPAGYDGLNPDTNRKIIGKWLSNAPSAWKSEFSSGMSERVATGQGGSRAMNVDNALKILGITAGGNISGDTARGRNKVPDSVRFDAMKGLALSWTHDYGGWNFIGVARAIQLAVMLGVPNETMNRMANFFGRNQKWKKARQFGDDSDPSRGYMAWLNWGGVAAEKWLAR